MTALAIIVLALVIVWVVLFIAGRLIAPGSHADETLFAFWIVVSLLVVVSAVVLAIGTLAGWPS